MRALRLFKIGKMNKEEKGLLSRIQRMNVDLAIFHEEKDLPNISENETLYFGEKIRLQGVLLDKLENKFALREEEIQKQIEAVRGLIGAHKNLAYGKSIVSLSLLQSVEDIGEGLRTLTATLKPYLNGEKLEM